MTDSIFNSLPAGLPPLDRAHRLQEEAARAGFDWPDAAAMMEKVREEVGELADACARRDSDAVREELGDLLFVLVNLARFEGLRAGACLVEACEKFTRRFRAMEASLRAEGKRLEGQTPEALDALWNDAKRRERDP